MQTVADVKSSQPYSSPHGMLPYFPSCRDALSGQPLYFNVIQINNKKRSHTQPDSGKQVIAFQDRVITINIKEAQHPLKREKQVIDESSIMLKISTKTMHRVLV